MGKGRVLVLAIIALVIIAVPVTVILVLANRKDKGKLGGVSDKRVCRDTTTNMCLVRRFTDDGCMLDFVKDSNQQLIPFNRSTFQLMKDITGDEAGVGQLTVNYVGKHQFTQEEVLRVAQSVYDHTEDREKARNSGVFVIKRYEIDGSFKETELFAYDLTRTDIPDSDPFTCRKADDDNEIMCTGQDKLMFVATKHLVEKHPSRLAADRFCFGT